MVAIYHRAYGGMRPRQAPETLNQGEATLVVNARLDGNDIEPWNAPSTVLTLTSGSPVTTIYKYGQDNTSETNWWFQFTTDVNVVKGPIDDDTEERTYWTGDGYPKKTRASLAVGTAPFPTASRRMGLPAPVSAPTVTVSGTPTTPTDPVNSALYVVCYRTSWGEVGKPSPASSIVTYQPGQTPTVTLPSAPSGAYDITHVQVYRSNSGTNATQYQFAAEVTVGTATWSDTVASSALGETIPSTYYDPPDDNMVGLTNVANAFMAGFFDNQVCFSEPGVPYAWPIRYRQSTDAPVVGCAAFDQSVVVSTKKSLYVYTGVDPSVVTAQKLSDTRVCVSKRSMIEAMGGVLYASAVGLMLVTASDVENLTEALMARKDWQAYNPSSMACYAVDNRVIVTFDTGTRKGSLVFSFGTDATMAELDIVATGGFVDRRTDTLYLVIGNVIKKWNGGSAMTAKWRSGVNWFPSYTTMRVAKVDADVYPVRFILYADGVVKFDTMVRDSDAFRLPGGFRAKRYVYEIQATGRVSSSGIAQSMTELTGGTT